MNFQYPKLNFRYCKIISGLQSLENSIKSSPNNCETKFMKLTLLKSNKGPCEAGSIFKYIVNVSCHRGNVDIILLHQYV